MSPVVITPQFPIPKDDVGVTSTQFFLPEVILWDPLCQFPAIFTDKIPPTCDKSNCGLKMMYAVWQDADHRGDIIIQDACMEQQVVSY